MPSSDEVDRASNRALTQLGVYAAFAVPLSGVVWASIISGGVNIAIWLVASILLGVSAAAAGFALAYGPRSGWSVPANEVEAFARQQAGIVEHRVDLTYLAAALLILSMPFDLICVIQSV